MTTNGSLYQYRSGWGVATDHRVFLNVVRFAGVDECSSPFTVRSIFPSKPCVIARRSGNPIRTSAVVCPRSGPDRHEKSCFTKRVVVSSSIARQQPSRPPRARTHARTHFRFLFARPVCCRSCFECRAHFHRRYCPVPTYRNFSVFTDFFFLQFWVGRELNKVRSLRFGSWHSLVV